MIYITYLMANPANYVKPSDDALFQGNTDVSGAARASLRETSWAELAEHNLAVPDLDLSRAPDIVAKYKKHMGHLRHKYGGISEFIQSRLDRDFPERYFIITYNDFPYYLENNIAHLVIWINASSMNRPKSGVLAPKKGSADVVPSPEQFYKYLRPKIYNANIWAADPRSLTNPPFIIFENAAKNKSVRAVPHYHLFIKKWRLNKSPKLPIDEITD